MLTVIEIRVTSILCQNIIFESQDCNNNNSLTRVKTWRTTSSFGNSNSKKRAIESHLTVRKLTFLSPGTGI